MRTFVQAKAFAVHEHQQARAEGWLNMSQMFARQCVGATPFGVTAREAFNSAPATTRHTSSPPPAGAIAYYGRPDQGSGHAAFVVEGGRVWSTDILRPGRVDRVDWDVFVPEWGLAYRGWIDTCPAGPLPVQPGGDLASYRQDRRVYRSKMRFGQADSDSVWNLQLALISTGLPFWDGPTGSYGRWTRRSCREFQRRLGFSGADADGIAGPLTVVRLGLVWTND